MPFKLICCVSLPPATILSVPIHDFAKAHEELAQMGMEQYFPCCGKSICGGCTYSCIKSGNAENCPYCRARRTGKENDKIVEELRKRVEVNNDADAMYILGNNYFHGQLGLLQDRDKAMELWKQAAALGSSKAHYRLGNIYGEGGDSKKSKFHSKAAAMAGNEEARCKLGTMEAQSGNMERAVKHWMIAASAGDYNAMRNLIEVIEMGYVSRDEFDSTLTAYNTSCAEMRSEARDAFIRMTVNHAAER
jgi:TPR repeat protein